MQDESSPIEPKPAPPGWLIQQWRSNFAWRAGPFYFRDEGPAPGVGFFATAQHANMGDTIHGGALLTLADMALFDICRRRIGPFRAVTITLNTEFLAPAPIGAFIEAGGEMTGGGRKILMCRGLVTAAHTSLMSFSGTLRRVD